LLDPPRKVEELTEFSKFVEMIGGDDWREHLRKNHCRMEAPPFKHYVDLWDELVEHDYECIVITSSNAIIDQSEVLVWLHRHLLPDGRVELHFINSKTKVQFDAIIEDRISNALAAAKRGRLGLIVNRPWTQGPDKKEHRNVVYLPPDEDAGEAAVQTLDFWRRFVIDLTK
jgi:hypothetical protein